MIERPSALPEILRWVGSVPLFLIVVEPDADRNKGSVERWLSVSKPGKRDEYCRHLRVEAARNNVERGGPTKL